MEFHRSLHFHILHGDDVIVFKSVLFETHFQAFKTLLLCKLKAKTFKKFSVFS